MFKRAKEWLRTWKGIRPRNHEASLSNSMDLLAAYRQREKDAAETARRAELGRPSEKRESLLASDAEDRT
jgi:hypothetical protein